LPISNKIWQNISINFVTDLPPSLFRRKAYDSILIIINRYSRIIQFISYNKNIDVPELAEIIKNQKFKYFDLFFSYVTDRGTLFISN
jgi:hypothetical protein